MKLSKVELMKILSKKANLNILFALDKPKKWSDLSHIADSRSLSNGIHELLGLGLIQITIIHDTPTGSKAYELTPLGKKIVKHIEEMKKEFEKYHSHFAER